MKTALTWALAVGFIVFISIAGFVFAPVIRSAVNVQDYAVRKVDEATSYKLKQEVENSSRAMIASYDSDRMTYLQYRDSDEKEQRGWADQAKMRANRTASTYNNYILKNSFVWANNVPVDIRSELDEIK